MTVLHLGDRARHPPEPAVVCHHQLPHVPLLAREEFIPLGQDGQDGRHKLVAVDAWGDLVIDWDTEFTAWTPSGPG